MSRRRAAVIEPGNRRRAWELVAHRRLKFSSALKGHHGCVNTAEWSPSGRMIVTGSDDCKLNIYCAQRYSLQGSMLTGHSHNIFSAKFTPHSEDRLVSCGADGEVRVAPVDGTLHQSKLVFEDSAMALQIEFVPQQPDCFLVSHEDGCIRLYDLRQQGTGHQTVVELGERKMITSNTPFHPLSPNVFATGASDYFARLFDLRIVRSTPQGSRALAAFAPPKSVRDPYADIGVSGCAFSPLGLLAVNYRNDDLLLFDAKNCVAPDESSRTNTCRNTVLQRFSGRSNSQTFLKQAGFRCNGQQLVSGGDCGNLFVWEVDTQVEHPAPEHPTETAPRQKLRADGSIVNCVTPHPFLPPLLCSGIDSCAKVFDLADEALCTRQARGDVECGLGPPAEHLDSLQMLGFGNSESESEESDEESDLEAALQQQAAEHGLIGAAPAEGIAQRSARTFAALGAEGIGAALGEGAWVVADGFGADAEGALGEESNSDSSVDETSDEDLTEPAGKRFKGT